MTATNEMLAAAMTWVKNNNFAPAHWPSSATVERIVQAALDGYELAPFKLSEEEAYAFQAIFENGEEGLYVYVSTARTALNRAQRALAPKQAEQPAPVKPEVARVFSAFEEQRAVELIGKAAARDVSNGRDITFPEMREALRRELECMAHLFAGVPTPAVEPLSEVVLSALRCLEWTFDTEADHKAGTRPHGRRPYNPESVHIVAAELLRRCPAPAPRQRSPRELAEMILTHHADASWAVQELTALAELGATK